MTRDGQSARNVDAVRRSLDLIESGDREAMRQLVAEIAHPECEWTPLIGEAVEGTYRGPDGLVSFFEDLLGSFEVRYEDRDLRAIGASGVLSLYQLRLTGRESGLEVDQEMGALFEFEDGLLRRGQAYPTHAEALRAAKALAAAEALDA
jgi:ketosteroid isomerase-like protein